ncbi:MAG: hypothetical protein COZ18_11300 [Flexibacter sp. CG_4_10_14_3_um_filter_32_15]|nr:MAG: hypothetical protein COZ18_11300 [Flexibacter sp. CG_4_10_14_3_um_filter_32_15]
MNKNIIIVAPHFIPSNLAAVHRTRLFAKYLPDFGWTPIVLSVDESYYEEELDENIHVLLSENLRVEKVKAFDTKPIRLIGDIGIRGYLFLKRRILEIIKNEKIDFLYLTIPSHYIALLGREIKKETGIPFGIDYIDPWVQPVWHKDHKFLNRHWVSHKLSSFLEPKAVKNVSLITGVAEGYYQDVLDRNPKLKGKIITAAMPYGGEEEDFEKAKEIKLKKPLFENKEDKIQLIYAGAMLPKAFVVLEKVCQILKEKEDKYKNIEIHFIGSGTSPNDPNGFNIKPIAEEYGLWQTIIFEYPKRIPYLDVLVHLTNSDGVFIIGSTEAHYTPSKVYQGILAKKPVFAILHSASSAYQVIKETNAGMVISFDGEKDTEKIYTTFESEFDEYIKFLNTYNFKEVNTESLEEYSAKKVTQTLVEALNKAIKLPSF